MSIRRNLLYNIVLNVSNVIFPVITTPYTARVLGVENIGLINFVTAYSSYFVIFACLGIPIYGVKEIAKQKCNREKRDEVFSELFYINLVTSLIITVIYITSILFIPALSNEKELLFIAGIPLYLSAFTVDWFFTGREKFGMITQRSLIIKLFSLCSLFIWVKDQGDVVAFLVISVSANVLSNCWNVFLLARNEVSFRVFDLHFRQHLKPLIILFVSTLAVSAYTILDTLMLGFFSNYTEVGYYTSAMKVCRVFLQIVVASGIVFMPQLANAYSMNDLVKFNFLLNRGFGFTSFFGLPITLGLVLLSPVFVPLFLGNEFAGAVSTLQILSFTILLIGLNHTFSTQTLIACGFNSKFLLSTLIGMSINTITNLVLIPHLGSIGASFASVFAELVVLGVVVFYAYKYVNITIDWKCLLESFISCTPFIFTYFIFPSITNWTGIVQFVILAVSQYLVMQHLVFKNAYMKEGLQIIFKILRR